MATEAERPPETGTVPAGPQRLSAREWLDALRRTFKEFVADDVIGLASEIAYSSILAFFPTAILLIGLLGLLNAYDDLKEFLDAIAPQAVLETIDDVQENTRNRSTSMTAFVLGAGGALWLASGAMYAVIKAINRAYDRVETRPYWKLRLTGAGLVLVTGVVVVILLLLIVFGGPLGEAIADHLGLGAAFDWLWAVLRWPIAFFSVLLFFAIVYYVAPNQDVRNWRWVSPGSLIGGLLWLGLSGLLALYTSLFDSYNETYGSIATGIVLLLWLNYSSVALLFGAELNAELDRQADMHAAGGPRAGLVHHARRTR